jgi:hypothetical protein
MALLIHERMLWLGADMTHGISVPHINKGVRWNSNNFSTGEASCVSEAMSLRRSGDGVEPSLG